MTTTPHRDPLAEAAALYTQYVELAEISDLAELAREPEAPGDYIPPPAGLVFTH